MRSTFQRWRPRRSLDSTPTRAMRGTIPRRRSQARCSAELYALSARTFTGRQRRGPRRDRIAGNAINKGLNAWLSWTLAAETATTSGSPAASDRTWSLLPFLPRSTGLGPVSVPPLLARTAAASTIADAQSTCPRAPSSSSTAWCSRGHSPALVQAVNRRCAVGTLTPNSPGRCRHAHPLVSTYTIAVNTARSSTGAVPPPCRRGVNSGINGSTIARNSSGTNRSARSDDTIPDNAATSTGAT
ncbi:hypothetical protein SAMN04489713_125119 [Actinomadura madurae]|uniref:Uncharacterized protein n=1 Tax=Actinomadura madurae TaxID=1993 RepID=A0A1I5X4Q0_9ACTN|nr:hypothetical protein SAMN04489713_125119 [Actinomadura madurae]